MSRETVRRMLLGLSLPKWSAVQWVLEVLYAVETGGHSFGAEFESSRDALHRAWDEAQRAARIDKRQQANADTPRADESP
ncbi:hypothetical protein [Streptomyces sp. NPDC048248]|uniref:hypothetical protein n=1 Tax=Streptomyces sp. NPDC048248 TaxID=3365523 RepID=UPI00371506A4